MIAAANSNSSRHGMPAPGIPTASLACQEADRSIPAGETERMRLRAAAGTEQVLQEFLDDAARFRLAPAGQSGKIVRGCEGEADKTGKLSRNRHIGMILLLARARFGADS